MVNTATLAHLPKLYSFPNEIYVGKIRFKNVWFWVTLTMLLIWINNNHLFIFNLSIIPGVSHVFISSMVLFFKKFRIYSLKICSIFAKENSVKKKKIVSLHHSNVVVVFFFFFLKLTKELWKSIFTNITRILFFNCVTILQYWI